MPSERSRVKFPLWRKKVDGSLFQHQMTTIPEWVYRDVFQMKPEDFSNSRKDISSQIGVLFSGEKSRKIHKGWITSTKFSEKHARKSPNLRFGFGDEVAQRLQEMFPMSHFREIERRLREPSPTSAEIEEEFPFFEFLDIEWDKSTRCIHLTCHFASPVQFKAVFDRFRTDGVVDRIEQDLRSDGERVHVTNSSS